MNFFFQMCFKSKFEIPKALPSKSLNDWFKRTLLSNSLMLLHLQRKDITYKNLKQLTFSSAFVRIINTIEHLTFKIFMELLVFFLQHFVNSNVITFKVWHLLTCGGGPYWSQPDKSAGKTADPPHWHAKSIYNLLHLIISSTLGDSPLF